MKREFVLNDAVQTDLHTIGDWLRWMVSSFQRAGLFYGHGTDNPWDDAVQLLNYALSWPGEIPRDMMNARLTQDEKQQLFVLIEERVSMRKPVPYITQQAWFHGLEFYVDENVLIPRSPIAELIEQHFEPWVDSTQVHRVLDLCTGSGCIGIACAVELADMLVDCVDISPEALQVARRNVSYHSLDERVNLIESDLFNQVQGKYDVIVSNPPYVDANDMASLPDEYQHEPVLALAAGDDGLDLVRRMLKEGKHYLNPQGVMIVEVGNSAAALEESLPTLPFTWLEFERGGNGVFVISYEELVRYQGLF
ncbi:50S ribosomal protein L3 glutamine methyltransferase [Piscirickettsia salmonis]|uniref:Ribosomal protein uL3 glutamine methyltransferase n=1 Tax=Piscirickettsia salmonis TaxID=1238 RepID=A0A1L6TBF6_PISSA|nr:50S ribosomal protein L3 N(5)-glutamine methyltransferase [Piscirickettsia salmonis]AKP73852.1 protein-(glutamine-N5) methyltransferase, ribosomal protein L3-specific [Piscirickettsia salmonis LF-89 = ATCC VR-1361]ALB22663.1 SAM-dependent methyltransferase [Piscirickettsia salmonis]ALY02674.1 ribosomal protein L3 N(5)-glutamine methyltransferase [Piscirickettsia salmonis]AMA42218.1 ribosomal protein L3 N(5)-glutamine methyltransferase [Piscirickettsia salmonis]AOS34693.1 ribosomal protein L